MAAVGRIHSRRALFELGQAAEGLAKMEIGISGFQRLSGVPRLQYFISLHAEAIGRIGRSKEALAAISEALDHVVQTREQTDHTEMLRLRRRAAAHARPPGDGRIREFFSYRSRKIARAQETKWWELRTSVSLRAYYATAIAWMRRAGCSAIFITGSPKASIPSI